jgi:hypothetical protein
MPEFDKLKVQQWLSENWSGPHECQVCKNSDWIILDNIWELRKFEGGGLVIGGAPVLPVVALMCNVCGQMLFFNAIAVKALERAEAAKVQDEH